MTHHYSLTTKIPSPKQADPINTQKPSYYSSYCSNSPSGFHTDKQKVWQEQSCPPKVREKAQEGGKKISRLIADTGYDTHEVYRYMHRYVIEPCVLVRSNAVVTGNILRDKVVREVRRGRRKWKRAVGYGRRWLVEGFFSAFKRWFGEYVSSVKFENIEKELILKVWIMNLFLSVVVS